MDKFDTKEEAFKANAARKGDSHVVVAEGTTSPFYLAIGFCNHSPTGYEKVYQDA
jgi:hypothetical protein